MAALFMLTGVGAKRTGEHYERRVPVIMYHSVCKTNVGEYVISPDMLRKDFTYLRDRGYTPVFVRDIIAFCDGTADLPTKPIVLTFDDGFYNNAFYAEKIAAEFDFKITVSVVGAYTVKERGERKRSPVYSYLNEEELCAMHKRGRVELANHTYDMHKSSPRKGLRKRRDESPEAYKAALQTDSERCRAVVQNACGYRMNVFTYPFGCYSSATVGILSELGYRAFLTCKGGINVFTKGDTHGLDCIMRYNRSGKADTDTFFTRIGV